MTKRKKRKDKIKGKRGDQENRITKGPDEQRMKRLEETDKQEEKDEMEVKDDDENGEKQQKRQSCKEKRIRMM